MIGSKKLGILLVCSVSARCPSSDEPPYCSGHGWCSVFSRCDCWDGWTGGDCSLRTCPRSLAWADVATADETAHGLAECSNRGTCDRTTGRCACDEGFEGAACERLECQGVDDAGFALACSGHGTCMSLGDLARWRYSALSEKFSYTLWDAPKIRACACDDGFTGPSCSERTCPRGDDPLTSGQQNEVQLLSCGGEGEFALRFRGKDSLPIRHDATAAAVERAIEAMGETVGDVTVTFSTLATACSAASFDERNVVTIEFRTVFGALPELAVVETAVETFAGSIDVRSVADDGDQAYLRAGASTYLYARQGDKEYEECARRGACDAATGVCDCYHSNFELYASSDLYGGPGLAGDCGTALTDITTCPGEEECNHHGVCRGSGIIDDDATPFPTPHSPKAGHWNAAKSFQCVCSRGWTQGDCAARFCPRGAAWFAYPSADDLAHDALLECSGVGGCDRLTGSCACPVPFGGAACEYLRCPAPIEDGVEGSPCSGHGRCYSMRDLASRSSVNGVASALSYGSDPVAATTWDADRIFGCLCDAGYEGHDCALRSCPAGDDPGTYGQFNEKQLLKCYGTSGTFTLTFREATTAAIEWNATAIQIKTALEALSTIDELDAVTVNASACTSDGSVMEIYFGTEHGDLPPIEADVSNLVGGDIVVRTDGAMFANGYVSVKGTTESEACSNRGLCNHALGYCECFAGYAASDGRGQAGNIADCGTIVI